MQSNQPESVDSKKATFEQLLDHIFSIALSPATESSSSSLIEQIFDIETALKRLNDTSCCHDHDKITENSSTKVDIRSDLVDSCEDSNGNAYEEQRENGDHDYEKIAEKSSTKVDISSDIVDSRHDSNDNAYEEQHEDGESEKDSTDDTAKVVNSIISKCQSSDTTQTKNTASVLSTGSTRNFFRKNKKIEISNESTYNWALLTVTAASSVVEAGGPPSIAEAAASAILTFSKKHKNSALQDSMLPAAAEATSAVLAKGGNEKIATHVAVSLVSQGHHLMNITELEKEKLKKEHGQITHALEKNKIEDSILLPELTAEEAEAEARFKTMIKLKKMELKRNETDRLRKSFRQLKDATQKKIHQVEAAIAEHKRNDNDQIQCIDAVLKRKKLLLEKAMLEETEKSQNT